MEKGLISSANVRKPSAEECISLDTTNFKWEHYLQCAGIYDFFVECNNTGREPLWRCLACFEPHSSKHPLNFRYVGTVLQFLTCPESVPDWCHCQFCSRNHITPNHQADFYCVQLSPSLVCSGKESPVLTHLWDDSWAVWALKSLPVFFPPSWVKNMDLTQFWPKGLCWWFEKMDYTFQGYYWFH